MSYQLQLLSRVQLTEQGNVCTLNILKAKK